MVDSSNNLEEMWKAEVFPQRSGKVHSKANGSNETFKITYISLHRLGVTKLWIFNRARLASKNFVKLKFFKSCVKIVTI